jgi:hypothetical protein
MGWKATRGREVSCGNNIQKHATIHLVLRLKGGMAVPPWHPKIASFCIMRNLYSLSLTKTYCRAASLYNVRMPGILDTYKLHATMKMQPT